MAAEGETGSTIRLLAWLSPSFPAGSFAYSHGLETAEQCGIVHDAATLGDWLDGLIRFGGARTDALLLVRSHRAVLAGNTAALAETAALAAALFAAPELALESLQQGAAFWRTVRAGWPHPRWDDLERVLADGRIAYPVAVGAATALHRVPCGETAAAWLHACAANGVSAGLRLGIAGQTEGQRILARLEPVIVATSRSVCASDPDRIGSASLTVDLMALAHETQRTRLFRS